MPSTTRAQTSEAIEALARSGPVARALELMDRESDWITDRHIEFTRIAAPTFAEQARADYFFQRFTELKLDRVRRDAAGNVLGEATGSAPERERRLLVLSAHLDTVFPAGSHIEVHRRNGRICGPGITDNGAGLAALLALARVVRRSSLRLRDSLLFAANVGEEGEGNLHGMRHLLEQEEIRRQVRGVLVLDGASLDHITAHGLGSRRFRVIVEGPGGHSWSDFGLANPIYALAAAVARFASTSVPAQPRTTFNVGEIQGGTSVNSVPHAASIKVDVRSGAAEEIARLAAALEDAVREAIEQENQRARAGRLAYRIEDIGERPAAELPAQARILETVRAVDRYLGIRSRVERSSTDANIPLSLGIEAVSLGGGGLGGNTHSLQEWYDPTGRELGLKRLLLALCALAGVES
jgi:acetylornithine deacetylase/succinyl-diaminopimelate desuccinylase-like protein